MPSASALVSKSGAGLAVNAYGYAVLEGEPAVTRDMVSVRVGLEDEDDRHLVPRRGIQIRLDCIGRIDDRRHTRGFVADEVRSASEVVVDELPEQHVRDATNLCGYIS